MGWDLYAQQPLILKHPENLVLAVAGVSPVKGGIVWWNADYLISLNMPGGQPGSGFADNFISTEQQFSQPEFVEGDDSWHIHTDNAPDGRVYRFYKPDEGTMSLWQLYQQYVPSLDALQQMANQQYGEPLNVADNQK